MRLHLLTIAVLTGPWIAPAVAGEPVEFWHPGFENAAAEAEATGRPMLIHFYADWCGPCRQMEARVLNQPSVREGLRDRVVAVKLNYDQNADLVKRFNIGALPCDLLVNGDGNELLRTTGFVAETAYVEQIERLAPATESRTTPVAMLFAMMSRVGGAQDLGAVEGVGTRLLVASGH